eukprot:87480-Chlamydomonas_euryale.AAC.1
MASVSPGGAGISSRVDSPASASCWRTAATSPRWKTAGLSGPSASICALSSGTRTCTRQGASHGRAHEQEGWANG